MFVLFCTSIWSLKIKYKCIPVSGVFEKPAERAGRAYVAVAAANGVEGPVSWYLFHRHGGE